MREQLDIQLDDAFDLKFENGDLVIGECTLQHQQLILLVNKGENREFPTRGVGIESWLEDDVQFADILSEVKREYERDGMKVESIKYKEGCIVADAIYE